MKGEKNWLRGALSLCMRESLSTFLSLRHIIMPNLISVCTSVIPKILENWTLPWCL